MAVGDARDYPPGPRTVAAVIGLGVLFLLYLSLPGLLPPLLAASGHPVAALVMMATVTPVLLFLGALILAPAALQRVLSRFTKIDLRDGGHVAAGTVMALTLFYTLGLSTAAGVAAVEGALGPPAVFEPPPDMPAEGAPDAPHLLAANLTADGVTLNWTTNASGDDIAAFRVYRAVAPGLATPTFLARVENATNYTDATARGGFQYAYAVTAVDAESRESAPSQQAAVLVPIDSALLYAGLIENLIIFVLPAILYVSFVHGAGPRGTLRAMGIHSERLLRNILIGIGAAILFLFVMGLATQALQQVQELPENERAQAIGLGVGLSGAFALAAASSFSEEVLFRGFLQPRIGMWGQAIVFGIAHISYVNVLEVVVVTLLALVFGYLYKRTGSLWAPIAAHFAFNFISVIAIVCTSDPSACGL